MYELRLDVYAQIAARFARVPVTFFNRSDRS